MPVPEQAVDLTANVSSSPYAINRFTIKVENADPELETTGKYQVGQTYLYTMTFGLKSGFAPLRYETDGKVCGNRYRPGWVQGAPGAPCRPEQ